MKNLDILDINVKKLKTRTKKALFLIIPVGILVALSIVLSSQIENIKMALEKSIFGTISQQYTVLEVKVEQEAFDPTQMFKNTNSVEDNRFSQLDTQTIESINGVSSAYLQQSLPVKNVKTSDLFDGKEVSFSTLSTLDNASSKLYTQEDFEYVQGEAIPIILNASSLVYQYEDWSTGETITLDMSSAGRGEPGSARISFMKSEALEYSKEDLIGKEFTLNIGGLDPIQDYTMSRDGTTNTITKMSDTDYQAKIDERAATISTYWDYDSISSPLSFTFKVVGIVEGSDMSSAYVPDAASSYIMSEYVSKEVNSRLDVDMDSNLLSTDFLGISYDGSELSMSNGAGMVSQLGRRFEGSAVAMGSARPGGAPSVEFKDVTISSIYIPGLVIQSTDEDVVGRIDDLNIYDNTVKYGDKITVVVNDILQRDSVVKALNNAGYAYQDLSDLDVFDNLQNTLTSLSNGFLVSFIVLVGAIVVFTMSKLISESTREIGIFRAIGMKKSSILFMFISQSLLYVFIGYGVGVGLGILLNFVSATFVSAWFSNFVQDTVSQTFSAVNSVDVSVFTNINWNSLGIYTMLLVGISFIISIIPSISATRISPIEAIKSE